MEIEIVKKIDIDCCNDCPYFKEHVDTSVCYDSFDEPNYDWYCKHPDADNGEKEMDAIRYILGGVKSAVYIYIGGAFHRTKCQIPEWCPFKK